MSLSAFLAENAVPVENIKFVASKRFLGEDGNPIPWEIKTITGTEDEALGSPVPSVFRFPARRTSIRRKPTMIFTLASWPWLVPCSPI